MVYTNYYGYARYPYGCYSYGNYQYGGYTCPSYQYGAYNVDNKLPVDSKISEKTSAKNEFSSSNGIKLAIGAGLLTIASIAFVRYGKKVPEIIKSILKKTGKKSADGAKTTVKCKKPKVGTPVSKPVVSKPEITPPSITPIIPAKALTAKELETQVATLRNMPDSHLCKNAKEYLTQLKPHNFAGDSSQICVTSKFNGSNLGYETVNLSNKPFSCSVERPEILLGQKITVKCLPDGRKAVYAVTPSGGKQPSGRSFENAIKIVSEGKEFTPVQKSLIEIMTTRGPVNDCNVPDILAVANFNNGGALDVNKDIFLSAIYTAREQIKGKIDHSLVQRAMKVAESGGTYRF